MSEGWQLRPATEDDLPVIIEIIRAEDIGTRGHSEIDLASAQELIAAGPKFDPARDQVVAEAGGTVLAAAILNPQAATIAVHPDHEAPALRAALLDWAERRQAELGRPHFRVAVPAANAVATGFYRELGYRLDRFYAEMVREFALTGPPALAEIAPGYVLRAIDPAADLVALHALDERAFSARPDYSPESVEEFDKRHLSFSRFAPEWSLLAQTETGAIGGSLIGSRRPGRPGGYVAVLGVDPDHRRRGLARALLLAAFGAIHRAGLPSAELHVASDNPGALELYTGVGMRQGERFDHYVRTPGSGTI